MKIKQPEVADLPVERAARPESLPGPPQALSTYEVLVDDDEEYLRRLLQIVLQQRGFRVRLAATGQEAVEVYRQHRETVDLVLMDVRMPGWDGPQTLAKLRILNPQVRCCFMSGGFTEYTEEELLGRGADVLLRKPFDLATVALMLWNRVSQARLAGRSIRTQPPQAL
jgi:two-component system, OmpR family, response regulator